MGQVLLVRHGQASFGAEDYDVLSDLGWEQGRVLGAWLAERSIVPTSIVRGGMRRHRETVEALGGGESPATRVDARWDEFDHLAVVAAAADVAEVDLADRRGFQAVFELATARWIAGEGEYDEPFAAFIERVTQAWEAVVADAGSGRTTVVVTSGGVIAAVCAALTGGIWSAFNTPLVNASITRVVVGASGARLLTFNEHTHLTSELLTYR